MTLLLFWYQNLHMLETKWLVRLWMGTSTFNHKPINKHPGGQLRHQKTKQNKTKQNKTKTNKNKQTKKKPKKKKFVQKFHC